MSPAEMENRIKHAYPDCDVIVRDTTGGGDHFEVRVASGAFQGLSRIQQHKAIMAIFDGELKTGEVHALEIKTMAKNGDGK